MARPVLIVIAGPNGSGKTTLTDALRHHSWFQGCLEINPDVIAMEEFGDWNDPDAVLKAARKADSLREACLQSRDSLAFETVFSTPDRVTYISRATQAGYFVRLFFVGTDHPSINIARVAQRVREGGHGVPTDKIISRYERSMQNLMLAVRIVDRAYVYDNSPDNQPPALLFRVRDGHIERTYVAGLPAWAEPTFHTLDPPAA